MQVDGLLQVMRQLVGWREEGRTVRDLLIDLSPAPATGGRRAGRAEAAATTEPGERTGMALARAHTAWGDAGGWEAEPDNYLDLASAEALKDALDAYEGTVVVVSHDRWLLRGFDRFLVYDRNAQVTEHLEPVFT